MSEFFEGEIRFYWIGELMLDKNVGIVKMVFIFEGLKKDEVKEGEYGI